MNRDEIFMDIDYALFHYNTAEISIEDDSKSMRFKTDHIELYDNDCIEFYLNGGLVLDLQVKCNLKAEVTPVKNCYIRLMEVK